MTTAATKQTLVVTKDELAELAEWETKFAAAKKKQSEAEKEVKLRRMQLAEKVLGVKTEDELKGLTPVQVQKRFEKRLEAGDWELGRGAPSFTFSESNAGRHPAWAKLYAEELGEVAAQKIKNDTPISYSYCVEVAAE